MSFIICLVRLLAMLTTTATLVLHRVAAQDTPAPAAPSTAAPVATSPEASTGTEVQDVTTVTVTANAFDERTDDSGCTPYGCTAENTFDGDLSDNSRWSCSAELVQAAGGAVGEECQIVYEFAEIQSVASVSVAFLKGDERTRTLAVNVNGELFEVIESGGTTSGLEIFELGAGAGAPDVLTIGLESQGLAADEFISIIEVELEVIVSVVAQPTGSPWTAAPAAMTAAPIAAAPVPATEVPATAVPVADVTPNTMSPVAVAGDTPIPATVSIATPAPGLSSSMTTSARDLEITPSPSASGSAAGSGGSPGGEMSPSGTTSYSSTGEVCFDYCSADDECMECLAVAESQYTTEYSACIDEYEAEEYCDAWYMMFCCYDAVSTNDCLALESYVNYVECGLEYNGCSIDDMACNHGSDWGPAPSPTADSTAAGSDSSSGVAPDATPAPSFPLSSVTSARDLEITPTPAAGNGGAGTSATSEGGTSTSDMVRITSTGVSSTGSLCMDCYDDDQCLECIAPDRDREDAHDACMDSGEINGPCDAAFLPFCCSAAVSGNDCMSNDAFVDFMQCIVVYADDCSFEDMTCPGVNGLEIAGNDSGSAAATAASWSKIVLTLVVGVMASVVMR